MVAGTRALGRADLCPLPHQRDAPAGRDARCRPAFEAEHPLAGEEHRWLRQGVSAEEMEEIIRFYQDRYGQ